MKKAVIYSMREDEKMDRDFKRAVDLVHQFNTTSAGDKEHKKALLLQLFGSAGEGITVQHNFRCDLGYNIHVGKNFHAGFNCTILDMAEVRIGDNCFLGPNVGIYTAGHSLSPIDRHKTCHAYPITIGNNVSIGANAVIVAGVTIGDNAVIAAGAIVTKDVAADVMVARIPAKSVIHEPGER